MKFKSIVLLSIAFASSSIKCADSDKSLQASSLELSIARCLLLEDVQDAVAADVKESGKVSAENKLRLDVAAKADDLTDAQKKFLTATPKSFSERSRSPLITDDMKEKAKYWDPFLKNLGEEAKDIGSFEEFMKTTGFTTEQKAAILQAFCNYIKAIGGSPAFVSLGSPTFAGCPSPVNLS